MTTHPIDPGAQLPDQPAPPVQSPPGNEMVAEFPGRERRFIFVQLLFSLTAAEIARQCAILAMQQRSVWEALPAWSHLALAATTVIVSWVGWSVSQASLSEHLLLRSVFSVPLLVLLVDVVLVICYFILVRGAEIPESAEAPVVASASNEADTLAVIFTLYFIWDLITKAGVPRKGQKPVNTLRQWLTDSYERLLSSQVWSRAWVSFSCMVLGVIAALLLRSVAGRTGVLLADFSLFCLVLLFRAMKDRMWWLMGVLALGFLVAGIAARGGAAPGDILQPRANGVQAAEEPARRLEDQKSSDQVQKKKVTRDEELEVYKQALEMVRHYSNLRFTALAVFITVSSALLAVALKSEYKVKKGIFATIGIALAAIFGIGQYRISDDLWFCDDLAHKIVEDLQLPSLLEKKHIAWWQFSEITWWGIILFLVELVHIGALAIWIYVWRFHEAAPNGSENTREAGT